MTITIKITKSVLFLVLLLLVVPAVSADWAYQETADAYYTPYADEVEDAWYKPIALFFDTNYSTSTQCWTTSCSTYVLMNYTNASLVNGSRTILWQVKDGKGLANITLPSDCTNHSVIQFKTTSFRNGGNDEQVTWLCYDYDMSAFVVVRDTGLQADPSVYAQIFEEGVFFNYTAPPTSPYPSLSDEASGFAGFLLTFGILVLILFSFTITTEYKKYAGWVVGLAAAGFGLWFLLSIV